MTKLLLAVLLVAEICCPFITKGADPLTVAKLIGDKLVRETPFAYKLELATDNKEFSGMQMIDFGRNFIVSGKNDSLCLYPIDGTFRNGHGDSDRA